MGGKHSIVVPDLSMVGKWQGMDPFHTHSRARPGTESGPSKTDPEPDMWKQVDSMDPEHDSRETSQVLLTAVCKNQGAMHKLMNRKDTIENMTISMIEDKIKEDPDKKVETTIDFKVQKDSQWVYQQEIGLVGIILDAKVESFCIGVQTAIKGAATAENKCNALGTELVRVFRILAASSKERPGKLHGCGKHVDSCVATRCQSQLRNGYQVPEGTVPRPHLPNAHRKKTPVRNSSGCTDSTKKGQFLDSKSNENRKTSGISGNLECYNSNLGCYNHQRATASVESELFRHPQVERPINNSVRDNNKPLEPKSGLHRSLNVFPSDIQELEKDDVIGNLSMTGRSNDFMRSGALGEKLAETSSERVAQQCFDGSLQYEMNAGFQFRS
eukprot:Gb_26686 [translate_table: standard]